MITLAHFNKQFAVLKDLFKELIKELVKTKVLFSSFLFTFIYVYFLIFFSSNLSFFLKKIDIDLCANNNCLYSAMCVPEPKQCFTTPCPQYRCGNNINSFLFFFFFWGQMNEIKSINKFRLPSILMYNRVCSSLWN